MNILGVFLPLIILTGSYLNLNEYRLSQGKGMLYHKSCLADSAQERAFKIYTGQSEWSHLGYKATIKKFCPKSKHMGEVLARKANSFDGSLEAWKKSPSHKRVILQPFTSFGIGSFGDVYVINFNTE